MRLVEEEHELRLLRIADLRQVLEELREQPTMRNVA